MKIKISNANLYILVDDEDYEWLNQWKWSLLKSGYARRNIAISKNGRVVRQKTILMHRQLLNAPKGMEVDHINHDKLDNRKANIRLATKQENAFNRESINPTSGYKGVYWQSHTGNWRVIIVVDGKSKYYGGYKTKEEAAKVYNEAAKECHGKFAYLNEI